MFDIMYDIMLYFLKGGNTHDFREYSRINPSSFLLS